MSDPLAESFLKKCAQKNRESIGYSDVIFLRDGAEGKAIVRRAGGGFLVSPEDEKACSELHIVPHGGAGLPGDLLAGLGEGSAEELAGLVLANCDTGTTEIAGRLIREIITGKSAVCVAYFGISRLLLDANRKEAGEQVPHNPYIGSPSLYKDYLAANAGRLREELLQPWLLAVDECFPALAPRVIFHHHSMDEYGQSDMSHDARPYGLRPPAQLFGRRWAGSGQASEWLAPPPVLQAARRALSAAVEPPADACAITIDDPLSLPRVPFRGCAADAGLADFWNVIYELRKDQVRGPGRIARWAAAVARMRSVVTGLAAQHAARPCGN